MRPAKLFLISALLFLSASLYAQTDSLKSNSQFQFHLVNGFSLSYLRQLDLSSGLRFKIDIGLIGNSGDRESTQRYTGANSNGVPSEVQNNKSDESSSSKTLKLNLNYLWFSNVAEGIRLYFGAGPTANYYRDTYKYNRDNQGTSYYPASNSIYERTSSTFELGLMGSIGLECSINEKLSLLAEYNLEGTYSWSKWESRSENLQPTKNITELTDNNNFWNYRLSNLKIGIAYKF